MTPRFRTCDDELMVEPPIVTDVFHQGQFVFSAKHHNIRLLVAICENTFKQSAHRPYGAR